MPRCPQSLLRASIIASTLLLAAGCWERSRMDPPDRELQESLTPEEILAEAREGNERYILGEHLPYDLRLARHRTAQGQFPLATVLGCIDSRVPVEAIFDLGIGDVFVARVAGNVVGVDTAGSIEYACNYAGSKVVVVMGHTNCGAVKGAIDGVENGNLTAVLAKLRPAIEAVPDVWGERSSANAAFVDAVAEQNVRLMVDELRQISPLLGRLERTDEIVIMGAMYDVSTGRVTFLAEE